MNYEKIILEMLARIQALEEKVEELTMKNNTPEEPVKKVTTEEIRQYIEYLKRTAASEGKQELQLKANEINQFFKLSNRYPMICNAMRQCMGAADTVIHETNSGYSSTLEILYSL